jgi:cell fate (sporulation/competence/biofilm development) regulator YlbF (YheA/YmcA/DUF963 family)
LGEVNVYDTAYNLAKAIKESVEYREMESALSEVNAETVSREMLEDFRSRQSALQELLMKGEEMPPEEMEKMQQIYEVIGRNPNVSRLFEAERRIAVLTEDVQRIIAEPLARLYKEE